ncbi:MAG TPA: hypothetical protein VE650_05395 [Acetobacteraceae bacterium]|jgi:hypothetical protein|nr:hypothetical protein [Acetobacteraceae bacterium]
MQPDYAIAARAESDQPIALARLVFAILFNRELICSLGESVPNMPVRWAG